MHLLSFRTWLIALVVCTLVIVFCVWFVDLPLALYVNAHVRVALAKLLDAELLFVPLGGMAIFACGCAALAGRALPRWADVTMIAGFSLVWAVACNYFLLQPFFGRLALGWWLAKGRYGFDLLHGHGGTGFPSGHATVAASFLCVFWLFAPRARVFIAAFLAAESIGIVLMNWHFVSDVIAGLFLGATAAIMTTAILGKRVAAA